MIPKGIEVKRCWAWHYWYEGPRRWVAEYQNKDRETVGSKLYGFCEIDLVFRMGQSQKRYTQLGLEMKKEVKDGMDGRK